MGRIKKSPYLLVALVLVLGVLLIMQRDRLPDAFTLSSSVTLETLSKTARGSDGSLVAVFASNKKIVRIAPDGSLAYLLQSRNNPARSFFFAHDVALADDGSLFVASTFLDTETLTVNREAILRFSPGGHHQAILYSIDHDPEAYIDNMGMIRSLQETPDGLRFCVLEADGIRSLLIDPVTGDVRAEHLTPLPAEDARIVYATISADGTRIAFSTGATEIYTATPGEPPVKIYDGRELPDEIYSIPSDVHYESATLFFSDLGRDAIMRLTGENRAEPVFDRTIAEAANYRDAFYECKAFQITPDHLVFPNNGRIVVLDLNRDIPVIHTVDSARVNITLWIKRIAAWLLVAAFVVGLLMLVVVLAGNATPDGRRLARQVALVALMIGSAVGVTTYMIFSNMNQRLEEESNKNLRGYLEIGRLIVDANAVDRIRHVSDYMQDDYRAVLAQLQQTITREGELQSSTFSGVYKVFGDKLTALAYHDALLSIFYPYDYAYSESIYAGVSTTGEPYIGEMVDAYGIWLVGVAPLINDAGETVGLLEVGVDQSAQREANMTLFKSTLIDLAMILFVLVFIFFEVGFFSSHVLEQEHGSTPESLARYDDGAVRFVSFLAITGVFMSAAFLPLFSKSLAPQVAGLSFEFIIGLPMVIETLSGAVIAMLYGHIRLRSGIKPDMIAGCLVIAVGLLVSGLAATFGQFIAGRVVVGMGMGLLMIAFRTYFLIEPDESRKESGIIALTAGVVAGINTGSVAGGLIANRIGMQPVFFIQAVLMILAAVAATCLIRNRHRRPRHHSADGSAPALSGWRFLAAPAVWSFFFFIFLPVTACGLFLGFLFPLYAESQGSSINEISLAFMLFGATSIYAGPPLTRLTSSLLGPRRSLPVGALILAGALLLFAWFQSMPAAYATIMLFGLVDSFLFNQGLSYFAAMPAVRRFGEDKAMGVYNVFESSGEALGPLVFGLAVSLSLGAGIMIIAGALGGSALLFWAISPREQGNRL